MNRDEILRKLAAGELSVETAGKLLAQLTEKPLTIKIGVKGGVVVGGLGQRYPTTLYKEAMKRLLANADLILKFIEENDDKLAAKEAA